MITNRVPCRERFWEIIEYLKAVSPTTDKQSICKYLGLSPAELKSYSLFISTADPFQLLERRQFTPSKNIDFEGSKQHSLKLNRFVGLMEAAIEMKKLLTVTSTEHEKLYYPQRVVFIDGDFSLIAEDIVAKSICILKVKECVNVCTVNDHNTKPNFARMEIDDYMSSVRLISETSQRLVLKIHSLGHFDLDVSYQYFENLCAFSNPQGDYIWGATIEANSKLYEWLYGLGRSVEILEPLDFKFEYFQFFDRQIKKAA